MWQTSHGSTRPDRRRGLAALLCKPVEWVCRVPLWVWALLLATASLVGALVWLPLAGLSKHPPPLQRLLSFVSIAAIVLGLIGAASDSEHWSAGMTAAALGALAMVAWAIVRSLSRARRY